jgi:hypothetical protein
MKKTFRFVIGVLAVLALAFTGCSNIVSDTAIDNGDIAARGATLSVSSISTGILTSNKTSGSFTILATSEKPVNVKSSSISYNGTSYSRAIDLKGGFNGTKPTYRAIQFSAAKGDKITVIANAAADRTLQISNGSSIVASKTVGSSATSLSYTTTASGTFYVYSKSSAISIFSIVVTSSSSSSSGSSSSGSSSSSSSSGSVTKITLYKSSSKVGTYSTIQSALNAVGSSGSYSIVIPKGTYNENYINYNGSASITIRGDTSASYGSDVIIKGRGKDMNREKGRELMELQGKCNIVLMNLSLVSNWDRAKNGNSQAEVLGFDSTGTLAAYNCSFKSHQDTMRTTGKAWFYKCDVEGDTDFIWMESSGVVALYEKCKIVSVYDKGASNHESYIMAPRATKASKIGKGVVLFNCTIQGTSGQTTYLFRNPWGSNSNYYNQGAVVGCTFSGSGFAGACAKSAAMGTSNQQYIGWKLDSSAASKFGSKMGSIGTLSSSIVSREYNGRKAILNRMVSTSGSFSTNSSVWDIDAVIRNNNMSCDSDKSSN